MEEPQNGMQRSIGRIEGTIESLGQLLRDMHAGQRAISDRLDGFERHLMAQDKTIESLQAWQQRYEAAEQEHEKRVLTRRDGILVVLVAGAWTAVLETLSRAADIARALHWIR